MTKDLAYVYYSNAIKLLATERRKSQRIDKVYRMLARHNVQAGLADWLANPFIRTALQILKKFTDNYKIREATRLLYEAGEEATAASEAEAKKKKKR
jgi:hypothetical protein